MNDFGGQIFWWDVYIWWDIIAIRRSCSVSGQRLPLCAGHSTDCLTVSVECLQWTDEVEHIRHLLCLSFASIRRPIERPEQVEKQWRLSGESTFRHWSSAGLKWWLLRLYLTESEIMEYRWISFLVDEEEYTVDGEYDELNQLDLSDVLLPPQVFLIGRTQSRHRVIRIHDCK